MFTLQNIAYAHPNKDVLFSGLNLTINRQEQVALIGNNGIGKSTLLKILAGILQPSEGTIRVAEKPYYIPQLFGQFNDYSIAEALQIAPKLHALHAILAGEVNEQNLAVLDDDWGIEERCAEALAYWQLSGLELSQKMSMLSGGQKTKVFLAGMLIHQPQIVLLDEPTNHLDDAGRKLLYGYLQSTSNTIVVVSHDRTLLNLLHAVCELTRHGINHYGGNYDFFAAQKAIEASALSAELHDREKALRKAKETERAALERQQKLDARGRKKQEKSGLPTISMNTLRNNAEKSTARMKEVHAEKTGSIAQEVNQLRKELPDKDLMKIGFDDAVLHQGKLLFNGKALNFGYRDKLLWQKPLDLQVVSGQRLSLKGANGSGKTTLIKLILGMLLPTAGTMQRVAYNASYIDQEYSLISNQLTVYEQVQQFNVHLLPEHELKSRLTHFLFTKDYWNKPCIALSGGEKMRLILCCLSIQSQSPDMIILDEPTNNLDIQNIEILTEAINEYKGTLIVVSHDSYFLNQINAGEVIDLDNYV